MALQEKKILAETISKIIKDVNHEVPEMQLIEDINIESQEIKEKASKLMEKRDSLKKNYNQVKESYKEVAEKNQNPIIFEDPETIEFILSNDMEK